jgi:uncharacterized protein YkwD
LIVATTAGADTTPDVPAMPAIDLPEAPAIPQLPGAGEAPGATAGQDGPDAAPQTTHHSAQQAIDHSAQHGGGQQGGRNDGGASAQHAAGVADGGTTDATPHRPGGPAAGAADQDRPAAADDTRVGAAAQKAAGTAAAQRDVSPASVSTSPSAPVQQQVLALVNENRRRGGCDDLSLDRRLILAAYGHAADMARQGYFAHESLDGDGAGDRVSEAGYRWRRYGENIARGPESAYEVVDGWMHSPEHRENILDCQLEQMGIGLAFAPDRTPYWVQDFATPR